MRTEPLRSGYTTGTCAAAATKAALQMLVNNQQVNQVTIELPNGSTASIPITDVKLEGQRARAEVIKDAGDDPDVTHGMAIHAQVELLEGSEIIITGGKGIGKVTKPGLSVPVGESAINPVPRQMIMQQAKEILPDGVGALITILAPKGELLARKTLNPKLGILGGISILGTTGIVRPMSEEAYVDSLIPQIDQAIALGHKVLVLTPGGMGERKAKELGVPEDAIVQTSNFIGTMIKECAKRGSIEGVLLFGHIGKLIKVSAGIFHTHSKVADGRRETLAAHAALLGAPQQAIREIMDLNTIDAGREIIDQYNLRQVYPVLAEASSRRAMDLAEEFQVDNNGGKENNMRIGTAMYALDGEILGYDQQAVMLGKYLGWQL